jgi:hypothetical protein
MFPAEFFVVLVVGGVDTECIGKHPLEHEEGDWSIVIILVTGRT